MENAAFAASGAASVQGYPGGMRVLVVEEDPAYLATLTQMLQRHGYQVTAKASPEEGLRALQENPAGLFDLVMTVVRTQGPGIDGLELLRLAAERYPVVLFSDFEPTATMIRAMREGACGFLTKPMREEEVRDVWQHVVRRTTLNAASGAAAVAVPVPDTRGSDVVVVRQDDTAPARKRGAARARLDDSGEGGSGGSQQRRKQRRTTTKRTRFNSSLDSGVHAAFVKAAEQLRGTGDYCPRGIRDLLEVEGVQLTIDKAERHMEKYRGDCLTDDLSAMHVASSSHYDIWKKNYSTPGSSGLYMRPQGATNINQTNLLSNGASPLGNESYRASHVGHLYNNGNHHGDANGNCRGKYVNGYDYQYGNGNFNDNANANGCENGNGFLATGSMVNASRPSNLAQQVHQVVPEGYGNGRGRLSASGNMVPSNLAQPVQQAMATNSLSPSSMTPTMDNPNPTGQQEFPRMSQLRYDGSTGGISMSPWPVTRDDGEGEELLRSYLQGQCDNEVIVIQSTSTADMTEGMNGDAAASQISAPQPQNLTGPLSSGSTDGNGTAGTSGGSDVETDGNGDCEISFDELEKFLATREHIEGDNGTAGTSGGSSDVATDENGDCEISFDELEKLLASREPIEWDNETAGTSGGSGVGTDGIMDRELSGDEIEKLSASREYIEWDNGDALPIRI
uniref:Uncharacterized protein n=1 Tax=Avena sativa TaxID=4498 RepID=A0ACD5TAQ8_AVESA